MTIVKKYAKGDQDCGGVKDQDGLAPHKSPAELLESALRLVRTIQTYCAKAFAEVLSAKYYIKDNGGEEDSG